MRIAIVAPLAAPLVEPASYGNHLVIADLARGLIARGHVVTVYAAPGSSLGGVRVCTVPVPPAAVRAFAVLGAIAPDAARALDEAFAELYAAVDRAGCDVVSQHAFDAPAIARADAWPAVHTLHLPPGDVAVEQALRGVPGTIAAVSAQAAVAWRAALGRDIACLPNGVPGTPPPVRAAEPLALIAGRMSREKGTATAIEIAHALGLVPVLAGEAYDARYVADEVRPRLGGAIVLGTLPRPALWGWMARAAVTLMPVEWDEPFGLVGAEAQLAGCPVVGFARGALPEVVHEDVGGYLAPPGDRDALIGAARRALALDRARVQAAARPRFAMAGCVQRHERALEAACASR